MFDRAVVRRPRAVFNCAKRASDFRTARSLIKSWSIAAVSSFFCPGEAVPSCLRSFACESSAACESLDWLSILQTLVESDTFDPHTLSRRLPGILGRLDELSSVVLSGIDDSSHPTATLRQCLAFRPSRANGVY
ncbi:inactivated superfamily I helicase [Variovorax boronicumulans]|uniref:hypothetical protein n=1 Tax=Variovorax boronicumulans TaxID=436515 RepID=UPI002788B836|nr:hypothetical protein [Variovorax boronicumulans]MDP9916730.1 inactivated superfamily I helicase [Variovorax boronicumulans]